MDDDQDDDDRQTASLAGLAVALALRVACLVLFHQLREKRRLEDCLLAGRGNCAPAGTGDAQSPSD